MEAFGEGALASWRIGHKESGRHGDGIVGDVGVGVDGAEVANGGGGGAGWRR